MLRREKMKKIHVIPVILFALMLCFISASPVIAESENNENELTLVLYYDNNGSPLTRLIDLPNYVELTAQFTGAGSFKATVKNWGVDAVDNVTVKAKAYNAAGLQIGNSTRNLGAMGAMATVTENWTYTGCVKVIFTLTTTEAGVVYTASGTMNE
jgi:hypothetical protein